MSLEWSDEEVKKFLVEYQKHECLWNPFHFNFRNDCTKIQALQKIVRSLNDEVTIEDCLRFLRCIRKKFLQEQTTDLLNRRSGCSNKDLPTWKKIVESMLEKIVRDEDRKHRFSVKEPKIKELFHHTITSNKPKKRTDKLKLNLTCTKKGNIKSKGKKQKKSINKFIVKLDTGRYCNDDEKAEERKCCQRSDCSRPQTTWGKCREDYLNNITWSRNNISTTECPAYAPRVKNLCTDPSNIPGTCYFSNCPNQDSQCFQKKWEGRKRHTELQPTEPRVIRSSVARPNSATNCNGDKKLAKDKICTKTLHDKSTCYSYPQENEKPKVSKTICIDRQIKNTKIPNYCDKETCPNYQLCQAMKAKDRKTRADTSSQTIALNNKSCNTCDNGKNVKFDQCAAGVPRVAARFENGVLEAYSEFKLFLPGESSSDNPKSSTKTTRDCGVSASYEDLKSKSCCKSKCSSKRSIRIGTDEDVPECCQDSSSDSLECEKTIHDYVLLTPGGKYVPLVRSTKNSDEKKVIFTECCTNVGPQQRIPEDRDNELPLRSREKQTQNLLDDEKCSSSTTKLLLRCFEHMLNLEEQEEKGKLDEKGDTCDPCRGKSTDRRCNVEKVNTGCLPCLNEKQTNNASSKGKLTQNFLEILKCAMDLDGNKKDECDDDNSRQDCCECHDFVAEKNEEATSDNCYDKCYKNQSIQAAITKTDKSISCLDLDNSCVEVDKERPCHENSEIRENNYIPEFCKDVYKSNDKAIPLSEAVNFESRDWKKPSAVEVRDACTQIKFPKKSKETRFKCNKSISADEEKRDDLVFDYLTKSAKCSEDDDYKKMIEDSKCQPRRKILATVVPESERVEYTKSPRAQTIDHRRNRPGISYVKCNQFYRSYVVSSPDVDNKNVNQRLCVLRRKVTD